MAARLLRRVLLLAAAVALVVTGCVLVASASGDKRAKPPRKVQLPYEAGTVLVRFEPSAGRDRRAAAVRRHGLRLRGRVGATGYERAHAPGDPRTTAVALARDPVIAAAQPNFRRRAAAAPDDPLFEKGRQGSLDVLRMPAAWDRAKATKADVVAILDSGIDLDHPDLQPQMVPGRDVVNADAFPADGYGHGTKVAGIAAARADDGTGMAGVGWGAGIMPVKVLDDEGLGYDDDVAAGMTWAADHGADVLNLSLGGPEESPVLASAAAYARAHGAIVVASAGNAGRAEPEYPAATPGVLAVGATDWSGDVASLSNHGPWLDLAAPGLLITSAAVSGNAGGDWEPDLEGTSFAAPVVAGAALLVRAQNPGWTPAQIESRLRLTAHDAGPPGADPYYGAGIVDPPAALGGAPRAQVTTPIDGDSSLDSARSITPGTLARGRIEHEGDEDWFTFTVGEPSYIAASFASLGGSLHDGLDGRHMIPAIELYDSGGRRVDLSAMATWPPEDGTPDAFGPPGRYYARVRSRGAARAVHGYEFGVAVRAAEEGEATRFPWSEEAVTRLNYPGNGLSTAIGDVTGDGRGDILVTRDEFLYGDDQERGRLLVLPTDDEGRPGPVELYDTGAAEAFASGSYESPEMDVTTADADGDGRTDAIVAAGRWIGVLHQRDGRLAPAEPVPGSQGARQVEVADLDADGDRDLVGSIRGRMADGRVVSEVVAYIRGNGTWRPSRALAGTGNGYHDVAVGDVTGDGRPDIVAAAYHGIQIAERRPDGGWRPRSLVLQRDLGGIAVGDVTGDGRADVVTGDASFTSEDVPLRVHAQRSGGGLAAPVEYATIDGQRLKDIELADIDQDGRRDVVYATPGNRGAVHLQRADGTLGPAGDLFHAGTGSHYAEYTGLAVGDFTGDGFPDLVRSEQDQHVMTIPQRTNRWPRGIWVRGASIAQGQRGVPTTAAPVLRFARPLKPASVSATSVRLLRGDTGAAVPAGVAYDAAAGTVTVRPSAALEPGRPYAIRWGGVRDTGGAAPRGDTALRFATAGEAEDTTAPDTGFTGGALGTVGTHEPRFHAHSTEPGTRTECAVDGGAFSACVPLIETASLFGGAHTFRVRAVDAAGNADPTPATRTFRIDSGGNDPANDDLEDAEPIAGATGRVEGTNANAGPDRSSDPLPQVTGLSRGGSSVWYRWTAPQTGTVTFDTAGTGFDTLLGVFAAAGPAGLHRLAADDDQPGVRTSRVTVPVVAGRQLLIAVDGFGDGRDAVDGRFALSWTSTPGTVPGAPQTTIDAGPADGAIARTSAIRFHASRPGARFECDDPDSEGYKPCSSPFSVPTGYGERSVSVRAIGETGATDPTPAVWRWTSGLNGAEAAFEYVERPPVTVGSERDFTLAADAPVSGFECRVDRGEWEACGPGVRVTGAEVGHHELEAVALSPGGRPQWGSPALTSWTVLPSRSTSRPAGWSSTAAPVRADFDGDGWSDLAVPVPGEDLGDVAQYFGTYEIDAGAVEVLYGSPSGFAGSRTQRWTQATPGIAGEPQPHDAFGSTVAAGDFDGDGRADLAIGVPHDAAPAGNPLGGMVHVLYGGEGGLSTRRAQRFNEGTEGVPGHPSEGDGFGTALAAGDADGDGDDDLAVGMPEEDLGFHPAAGSVHLIKGTPSGLAGAGSQLFTQETAGVADASEGGDRFGDVLAFGDFDANGTADLAVAAPGEDVGSVPDAGAVTVLPGSASGVGTAGSSRWTESTPGVEGLAEEGDGFGTALSAAPLDGTPGAELAIGVPGEDVARVADGGSVHVLPGRSGGLTATGSRVWTEGGGGLGGTAEAGDRFGSALAAGNLGGTAHAELIVGVPDEDAGSVRDSGAVHVLPGSAAGPTASGAALWSQLSAGVPDTAGTGDRFGAFLSTGGFGGSTVRDLAIGVPGEAAPGRAGAGAGAGAVNLLFGASAGLTGEGAQYVDQDSPRVGDTGEGGDGFGAGGPSR